MAKEITANGDPLGRGRKKGQPQTPQCTAIAKGSQDRCLNAAIPGGTVCKKHGGSSPQVRAAADRRILDAQEAIKEMLPAATREMERILTNGRGDLVRFNVAKDILDRAGLQPVKRNEHKVSAGEYTFTIDSPADQLDEAAEEEPQLLLEGEVLEDADLED